MIGNVIIHKKLFSYIDVRATYDVPNCMGAATKYNITKLVGYHDFMFQCYHVAEVGSGPYFTSLLSSVQKLLTQASDVEMEHNIIDYTICMNMQTFHEQCLRVSMSFLCARPIE